MFAKLFITSALVAVASAAPLATRGCTPGQYNCLDGKSFQQCLPGGVWAITMAVAPGTTCNIGISDNPWLPGSSDSNDSTSVPTQSSVPAQASTPVATASQVSSTAPVTTSSPPASVTSAASATVVSSSVISAPVVSTSVSAAPAPSSPSSGSSSGTDSCSSVKDISSWESWTAMKARYASVMGTSCQSSWNVANNSPEETQQVLQAIEQNAGTLDPRFILAVMIQESSGCVRVPTTNNGVRNPGLMQDANGSHSCNDAGTVQNPCPVSEINGMIADGVSGGDNNYQIAFTKAQGLGFSGAMQYAVAARMYNSGLGSFNGDLCNGAGSTNSYVTDIIAKLEGAHL